MSVKNLYDSTPLNSWVKLLAKYDLHYHFALRTIESKTFESKTTILTDNPFAQSVAQLLPYLSQNVLDLGCGYGGPARFLNKMGHHVTCVSHSQIQLDYINSRNLDIDCINKDLNKGLPSELTNNDNNVIESNLTALMLESFSHINPNGGQQQILKQIHNKKMRLVMVAHATYNDSFYHPHWKMQFHNINELRAMIENSGFNILVFKDEMPNKATLTAKLWQAQLATIPMRKWQLHWHILAELSTSILKNPAQFIEQFALLTIVAEP